MKYIFLIFVILFTQVLAAEPFVTYWVDKSCHDPKFGGGFELGLKDARHIAERGLIRLDEAIGPYRDTVFELMFIKPRSDTATFNRVRHAFDTIANRLQEIPEQLKADIRFYCDNDEEGPGKRWTIVPDDPDDPAEVKNSNLKRFWDKNDDSKNLPPLQQWEDKTNWVRMSLGTAGVKQSFLSPAPNWYENQDEPWTWIRYPLGEVQHRAFDVKGETPVGINPDRVTITISDYLLLGTELVHKEDGAYKMSHFEDYARALVPGADPAFSDFHNVDFTQRIAGFTFFHELCHMNKPGFYMIDVEYGWADTVMLREEQAMQNAETYTFFAFLMQCADKGYRLQMTDNNNVIQYEVVKYGKLVWDQNLEKAPGWNNLGPTPGS